MRCGDEVMYGARTKMDVRCLERDRAKKKEKERQREHCALVGVKKKISAAWDLLVMVRTNQADVQTVTNFYIEALV